jgi:hypothetical protein
MAEQTHEMLVKNLSEAWEHLKESSADRDAAERLGIEGRLDRNNAQLGIDNSMEAIDLLINALMAEMNRLKAERVLNAAQENYKKMSEAAEKAIASILPTEMPDMVKMTPEELAEFEEYLPEEI